MKNLKLISVILLTIISLQMNAQGYKNFKVAVYCRAYEVEKMADPNWLTSVWDTLSRQLYVDRIYLETHRDLLIVPDATLNAAKKFFQSKGVEVAGGITYTIDESNNFQTFCYTNPENRLKVKEIAEHTAKHFDFFILDDFFFTSCKCDLCVAAKGEKSWTDFRLDLMKNAANDLVINPAKKINPKVQVIIKYPNWYEHFQGLGFNLEAGPVQFDGVYTGTETRDRSGNQHLQQYLGYAVFRYYENLKPGKNFGGWVDTGGGNPFDRYAEQLWITMFAKAPEITLFDIRQMNNNYNPNYQTSWKGTGTSFDFDEMKKPLKQADGSEFVPRKFSGVAGYSLSVVDKVLGGLGNPVGVKCYKPFHSLGEDFLQTYLGMIGIPVDIVPQFPENEPVVLLTETASFDKDIVTKIKKQLQNGKNVVATSGFYKAMQGKGIENIAELKVTDRKASVKEFAAGWGPTTKIEKEIIIPQVTYLTNDSWEIISARDDTNGWPILHAADFSKGKFYVLTIPDNFIDLYILPENVLNRIRETVAGNLPVILEAPGEISLFAYDNKSFVVESFLDKEVTVKVLLGLDVKQVKNLETGETKPTLARPAMSFRNRKFGKDAAVVEITINPHSFKAFSF